MYDILGKLKNLMPGQDKPADVAKEPVYESVEPRGSITEAVKSLEEKYMGFKKVAAAAKKGGAENPEAVAASIGRKKYGKAKFQKAAAAGKKLGEAAKPDFLDVDSDGNKKETFKKAVKDKEAKKVEESGGPYELYNPKHPKFAANYKKFKAKNPNAKLEDFINAMREKEHEDRLSARLRKKGYSDEEQSHMGKLGEGEYDPAAPDAAAIERRKRLQAIKDRREELGHDKDAVNNPIRKVAGKAYGGAAQRDVAEPDELDEYSQAEYDQATADFKAKGGRVEQLPPGSAKNPISTASRHIGGRGEIAGGKKSGKAAQATSSKAVVDVYEKAPPGAKAERMVKHIKAGYAKDGKLTKREKGIAYATAWKAHNAGQVEEGVKFGDTIENSKAEMKKAKKVKVTESRVMEETDYFYEQIGKALAEKNPTLNTASPDFVTAIRQEMVAQGIPPNRARGIIMQDEDFISDVATSYSHYCQEIAECGAPINSHLGGEMEELDEIARLAGLQREGNAFTGKLAQTAQGGTFELDGKEYTDTSSLGEAEMDEGNEYTKARLDAIRAGKDVFTVGGKVHKVSGDTSDERQQVEENFNNVTINVDGYDAVHVLQLLSGLQSNENEVAAQPAVEPAAGPVEPEAEPEADLEEERDIEYINTPNEKIAPIGAAMPSGNDLHKSKLQDPRTANKAANPLAEKELEESLWSKYEDMIGDIKA